MIASHEVIVLCDGSVSNHKMQPHLIVQHAVACVPIVLLPPARRRDAETLYANLFFFNSIYGGLMACSYVLLLLMITELHNSKRSIPYTW